MAGMELKDVTMKHLFLIVIGLILFFPFMSGCIETGSSTKSVDTVIGSVEIKEHTYLWGDDGFFTKRYDVKIRILGREVVDMKGITNTEMDSLLARNAART